MSNASTISHYIKLAASGQELNGENITELEDAINGLVADAVSEAVRRCGEATAFDKLRL